MLEGDVLRVELTAPGANADPGHRDTVTVTATRSETAEGESFALVETGPSSGVFRGSLPLAKYLESGPGLLDVGPLPATVTVTYASSPEEILTASAEVNEARVELIDTFGRPATSLTTAVRVRLLEYFYQAIIGIGGYWLPVEVASLDQEYLPVYAASPGVYESAPLAIVADGWPGDGALTAPAGSTVTASHTLTTTTTTSATVGATLELMDAPAFQPAVTFLSGERLGIEARIPTSEAASLLPGLEAEIRTGLANDLEIVQLTRTSPGVFRGSITAASSQGAPAVSGNGVLEEAQLDHVSVGFPGGIPAGGDEAQISGAARLELLDAAGRPASRFGSGETVLVRVSDFTSADLSGGLEVLVAEASCSGIGLERLRLRETAGDSHVFEARLPVEVGSPISLNGRLECPPSSLTLRFAFENPHGATLVAEAELADAAIFFVDAGGALASAALDGARARLRVVSSAADQNQNAFDQVDVAVTGLHTGDTQQLALRETTLSSGIFEGEVLISSRLPGNPDQIDVTAGAPPLFAHDRLGAAYSDATAAIEVVPARLELLDQEGRELERVLPDTSVFARLEMPALGSADQYDYVVAEIGRPYGGSESWPLFETAADSGVFTSSYWLGNFQFSPGEQLAVFFTVPDGERMWKLLPVVGLQARFLDAAGSPVTTLSAHQPVVLELSTPGGYSFPALRVATERGGDAEILPLEPQDEAGRIFRGTLPLRLAAAVPGDGTLSANGSFPFGDTVTVELSGTPGMLASAPLQGPRLRFLDADGREQTHLTLGRRYQIELDDAAANLDPLAAESRSVTLLSTDDPVDYPVASVPVHETGLATGIFRGSFLILGPEGGCPSSAVTCFSLQPGMALFARHTPAGGVGAVEVHATTVGQQALALIDDLGRPVHEVLEGAPIRVRLTDATQIGGQLETRILTIGSRRKGDLEALTALETSPSSGVFEASLPTRFLLEGISGYEQDGELALGADPLSPLLTRETVVIRHASGGPSIEVVAPTVAARLAVLDDGQPAAAILPGNHPRILRLECPSLDAAGQAADFVVETDQGDLETFSVLGNGDGIFEVPLPFASSSIYQHDGVIAISAGVIVTFRHQLTNGHAGRLQLSLPVAGAQLRFLDPVSGEPLASSPDLRPLTIQLIESETHGEWPYETRIVTLATALGGDLETFELHAVDPAVFEGTLTPRIASGSPQPGVLEVDRRASPNGAIYDVVTVSMPIGGTTVSASLPLSGPRAAFTDVIGNPSPTITFGTIAHVLVDDPLLDADPLLADTVTVRVDEAAGSSETAFLEETGPHTGVFRGGLPVSGAAATAGNGVLEPLAGSFVQLVYEMPGGYGSVAAEARVVAEQLSFLDAAGLPTGSYLDGENLRLRLVRSNPGSSPTYAEEIPVEVRAVNFSFDVETVVLVETAPDSNVYEGELASAPGAPQAGNGRLDLGHGVGPEKAFAAFGEASATATFSAGSLRFLDRLGRELASLVPGQYLGVELKRRLGTNPHQVDVLQEAVRLTSPYPLDAYGDEELLTLVETGPDTGVFHGFIPTTRGFAAESGRLEIYPGAQQVRAFFEQEGSQLEALIGVGDDVQPPALQVDFLALAAGGTATVDVLANDVSADGSALTLAGAIGTELVTAAPGPGGLLTVGVSAEARGGLDQVTYLVTDAAGLIFESYLYVEITPPPPAVRIFEPLDGAVFAAWQAILFNGDANDLEDGDLTNQLQWSSDIQPSWSAFGGFYEGTPGELIPGKHVITARAADSEGNVGSATVTITIDGAPRLEITYPDASTPVLQAGPQTFTATVSDEDQGLGPSIRWYDEQGTLGTGEAVTVELQAGAPHTITAVVEDSAGNHVSVTRELWINGEPSVALAEPLDGRRIPEGEPLVVAVYAGDVEDDELTIEWRLDGQLVHTGTAATFEFADLALGLHHLSIRVIDSDQGEAALEASFQVVAAPELSLLAPSGPVTVEHGTILTFTASASDLEDGDISAGIRWTNGDTFFASGASISTSSLEAGRHTITANVSDSDNMEAHASVEVEVVYPPSLHLAAPLAGSYFPAGAPVVLQAFAIDGNGEDLSGLIEWTSSRDGALGAGSEVLTSALSAGPHLITASVTDSHGLSDTRTVAIEIGSANTAPVVVIAAPLSGSRVATSDDVTFSAGAIDAENGDLSAYLVWTSSLVGPLGTGGSIVFGGLPAGTHIITATVGDEQGLAGAASVTLEVKALATGTFVSIGAQDGFVLESGENTGAGGIASTGQLRLGDNLADRQYRSFLSFDTSSLPDGALIRKVTVRAQRSGITGTNPATTHGDLSVDVRHGSFGASAALQNDDFAAAASAYGTCLMTPAAANGQWSAGVFDAAGRDAVNLDGMTQLRLQLALDDDDDGANDYLDHYGGESTVASTRPQLIVEYLP